MAIDRIGKGGSLPVAPETGGAGGGTPAGTPGAFKIAGSTPRDGVDPAAQARSNAAHGLGEIAGADPTSPLERVRAGEIDVHGYVDRKVDEATARLHGLPSPELDAIKSILRDQLRSDPGLADLVRTATGKMPTPPED